MNERDEQRLMKTRDKIAQMKTIEQSILARDKKYQRKERTRRLIQNGALSEKYLHCDNMEPREFEKWLQEIIKIEGVQRPSPDSSEKGIVRQKTR